MQLQLERYGVDCNYNSRMLFLPRVIGELMWIRGAPWQMSRASPCTKSIKKQHSEEAECWCHRTVNIHTYNKHPKCEAVPVSGFSNQPFAEVPVMLPSRRMFQTSHISSNYLKCRVKNPTSLYFNDGCSYNSISEDDFDLNESLQAVHETTPCKTNLPCTASLYQKTSESFLPGLTQVALAVERHDQRPVVWRWRLYSNLAWHCYTLI